MFVFVKLTYTKKKMKKEAKFYTFIKSDWSKVIWKTLKTRLRGTDIHMFTPYWLILLMAKSQIRNTSLTWTDLDLLERTQGLILPSHPYFLVMTETLQWPEPPQTKRPTLEQAGEQHTSRFTVIPRRTEAAKDRDLPGKQSAAAETARESMLERTTRAAVHMSMDCRACTEHCVTEYTNVNCITVRSAVL